MSKLKIPKRVSTALMNSLGSGVVPRIGLGYVAVGRKDEISALLQDIDNISDGAAAFRFIIGRYGSGKTFLLQLLRNYSMDRNFVVADADLSQERRLAGSKGQGLATYRELMKNLSTKTRPDGNALPAILEKWISGIQNEVIKGEGLRPDDENLDNAVEIKIMEVVNKIEGMVHGFDFGKVISTYWRGQRLGDDEMKRNALKWFNGEYSTKTEAKNDMQVNVIVDDSNWYDYLKLIAKFSTKVGYKGLLTIIDEAVNLYKISHPVSRKNNYEKMLTIFNDTMQGKVENLGVFVGITPNALEDQRRGLYSYEALRSRLTDSRFAKGNFQNILGPKIRLQTLTQEEIFLLLNKISDIHATHNRYEKKVSQEDLTTLMQEVVNRVGAKALMTPREIIRDLIFVLDKTFQEPEQDFKSVILGDDFQPTKQGKDPDLIEEQLEGGEGSKYKEFTL